jgi:hypothetical protein
MIGTWNIFPQISNEMERKHENINVKLTFVIKCFYKWKEPCNPCRYIHDQISKKFLFQLIALIVRTCGFKFFCCIVDNPNHFYFHLKIVTYFNHFFSKLQFLGSNQLGVCTFNMCPNRSSLITVVVFDKHFL